MTSWSFHSEASCARGRAVIAQTIAAVEIPYLQHRPPLLPKGKILGTAAAVWGSGVPPQVVLVSYRVTQAGIDSIRHSSRGSYRRTSRLDRVLWAMTVTRISQCRSRQLSRSVASKCRLDSLVAKDARKSGRSCETRQDKTKFEVQSAKDKAQRERVPNKLQLNESLFYFNLGVLGFWGFGVLG